MSNESAQNQHDAALLQQSRMSYAIQMEELCMFALLKPKLYRDGDQWCVLYGENIQEGVVGFGDTPYSAISDWNGDWHRNSTKENHAKRDN